MIIERINKGILLGLLLICAGITKAQVYPQNGEMVSFNSTEMVNESVKTIIMAGCESEECSTPYKKVNLVVDFSLADDFAQINYGSTAIPSEIDVIITANKCGFLGQPPYTLTQHLEIDTDNPRQVFQLDFTSVYLFLDDIEITVANYVVPVGYESSVQLNVGYKGEFLFPVGNKTVATDAVTDVDLTTNSAKLFEWTVDCGHYAMYEFQLLKLENHDLAKAELNDPQDVIVNVDWSNALTIHTYSWQKFLRLTLTQGTGYYTWRVRGIGNQYDGNEANPKNWDTWSPHVFEQTTFVPDIGPAHTFYYNQFDEDKNWNYSRVFIEGERDYTKGVRIGEQIGYANGLLQAKQSQSILNTNHQVVASESVQDYSGRASLKSITAPVYGQSSLGFKENFFISTDGTAYDASNFDDDINYKEPEASRLDGIGNGFGYYSEYNTTETYVASVADTLNANIGYPFSRTRFYNDGRLKESSGVGFDHRMHNDISVASRTSTVLYGGVADAELLRVLGNEAPDAGSVHKVVSIDPNKTTSITYINKAGQTLFTCLGMPATDDYALIDLESQAGALYNVAEYVDPLIATDQNTMERIKDLILTAPTNLTIDYNIATNLIENTCANFCTTCEYKLEINVIDKETDTFVYDYDEMIDPTTGCAVGTNAMPTHIVSLLPGDYRIEQRLIANGLVPLSLNTQLEEHVINLVDYLTENIMGSPTTLTGDLYEIMTHIDNSDLVALYAYLDLSPDALLITELNGNQYYDLDITIETGTPCLTIQIPVLECQSFDCPDSGTGYTALLGDYGLTTAILEYEYAQDQFHTYTPEEINILITNMLDDSADACQLWNCWRSQVLGYEAALEIEASLNNTPEGADYQYVFMNSFLDCAIATQYPAGDYPLVAGTIVPEDVGIDGGYIWSAHNHFYYDPGTYGDCIQIFDPVGAPGHIINTINWSANTNLEMQGFYGCISNVIEGIVDPLVIENNIYESIQNGCEASCESKRKAFEQEVIDLYRSEGKYIEGDQYEYVLNPAGVPTYIPDYGLPYSGLYHYTLDEISCAVDVLVAYCLGNCEVSNPITAIQQSNVETVLTSTISVSRPNLDGGCREDGVLVTSDGMADYMISWNMVAADGLIHSTSPEASLIDMEKDGSGHVSVLAGNRVTKYGSSGQVIWTKLFDTEFPGAVVQGIQPISGGYLLSTSNYLLVRLDGSGNVVWMQDYSLNVGTSSIQYASKPIQTENGDIYILWYAMVGGSIEDIIVHTDDLGNFDWVYTNSVGALGGNNRAVVDLMDSDILVGSANGTDIYKMDNSGVQVWSVSSGFTDPFINIRGIDQISIDKWAIIGNNAGSEAIVYQIESNGTVSNSGIPDVFTAHVGRDISASTDGDYIAATTSNFLLTADQFVVTQMTSGTEDWSEDFGSDEDELNCQLLNYSDGRILLGGTSPDGEVSTSEGYKDTTTFGGNFWEAWFVKFSHHNDACHYLEFCAEWLPVEIDTTGYPEPTIFEYLPCEEVQASYLLGTISAQVGAYINEQKQALIAEYQEECLLPENINDTLKLSYEMAGYHYMLYYYDRVGNLIKTVPPQGVELQDLTLAEVQNRSTIPKHTHVTDYQYNSLGQMTRSHTPDGGESKFYYDAISRLRFSQNAYQVANEIYSYMKYDDLGRVIEAGTSTLDASGQGFIAFVEDQTYPSSGTSEWTRSVYSTPFAWVEYKSQSQQFLRNRISYVYNDEGSYTYYSYDPHGNVAWLVQEIPGFDRFSVAYDYDLLSGNVLLVSYNDDSDNNSDKFFHRYAYDGDNRMLTAETSTDKVIWDVDQENTYNSVGIMNRKLTGQDQVQGTDYVSTVQGWLKGINHSSLSTEKDPGQDGYSNTVGEDAFGMILNYYDGDYRRNTGIGAAYTNTDEQHLAGTHDLYNGNISSWASRIPDQTTGGTDIEHAGTVTGYKYRYDELQRIKSADFNTLDADDPTATWATTNDYHTEYTFDANGNLIYLLRNAHSNVPGTDTDMDEMDYVYFEPANPAAVSETEYLQINNQLILVADGLDAGGDIDDIIGTNNYTYDEIGRLTSDLAQDIDTIKWTALQKVSAIIKTTGEIIRFKYDALGNRIAKELIHPVDPLLNETTYYVRDAAGNPMATYNKSQVTTPGGYNNVYKLTEHTIYGSDRVGLFTPEDVVVKEVDQDGLDVTAVAYDHKTALKNWNLSIQNDLDFGGTIIPFINEMNYNSLNETATSNANTGAYGKAGKNNAVLEDEYGTLILSASTHRTYNGVDNVTVIRDGNGNLVAGSGAMGGYWDGQSIFVNKPSAPGSTQEVYYLINISQSGELKSHRIGVNGAGEYVVISEVIIPGNYAQGLAIVDDRSGDFQTQILAIKQGVGEADLVSITVGSLNDDFGLPVLRQNYDYEVVAGNIAISPTGQSIALSTEAKIEINTGWFTFSLPYTILYNNDYTDYETVTTSVLKDNGFSKCPDISYAPLGDFLFYANKQTGADAIHRWEFGVSAGGFPMQAGAVQLGENDKIFVLTDDDTDSNNDFLIAADPGGMPSVSYQTVVPVASYNNYLKADLPLQPHIIKDGSPENLFTRTIGNKMYELKDHLGNVRTVVTDRKLYDGSNYTAEIISEADYYPYGMQMPGRQQSSNIYRYGFQGQEKDDEG